MRVKSGLLLLILILSEFGKRLRRARTETRRNGLWRWPGE